MTHVMPRCCQVSTSTPPRGSATLPGSVAHPEVATDSAVSNAITGADASIMSASEGMAGVLAGVYTLRVGCRSM